MSFLNFPFFSQSVALSPESFDLCFTSLPSFLNSVIASLQSESNQFGLSPVLWSAINSTTINSPWNFTVKSKVRVDFGENFEIYLSQILEWLMLEWFYINVRTVLRHMRAVYMRTILRLYENSFKTYENGMRTMTMEDAKWAKIIEQF